MLCQRRSKNASVCYPEHRQKPVIKPSPSAFCVHPELNFCYTHRHSQQMLQILKKWSPQSERRIQKSSRSAASPCLPAIPCRRMLRPNGICQDGIMKTLDVIKRSANQLIGARATNFVVLLKCRNYTIAFKQTA